MTMYTGDRVIMPRIETAVIGNEVPTRHYMDFFRGVFRSLGFDDKAPVYKADVWGVGSLYAPAANGPGEAVVGGSVRGFAFDSAADEELHFSGMLRHDYREGSALLPFVLWEPTTADAGNVVWGLDYSMAIIGDALPSPSSLSVTSAAAGVADTVTRASFDEIEGEGLQRMSGVRGRVFRDANNAADTYGADATLCCVGFVYQGEGRGSMRGMP